MLLRNAVDNALKFSAGVVRVTLERDTQGVVLLVEDEGNGVPEADRIRVFEPFYRGDAAKRSGVSGSGLGLALIAHIALIHRGHACFEPSARGARLRIVLPAWEREAVRPHGHKHALGAV